MSKLTRQDFFCGAGLGILFRKNEYISPSYIETINDVDGKNVVGIFYKFKTQNGNEAIVYIKFSTVQQTVKNLSKCWKFSLSLSEKKKISKQIAKDMPFFIMLVCVDDINKDNISGEIALLTKDDYDKISNRSYIIIGLWTDNDESKLDRPKVYVIKTGKGLSRDYYFDVKRNQVEKESLDDLIAEYYPSYEKKLSETICKPQIERNNHNIKKSMDIIVSDNAKQCLYCKSKCKFDLIEYSKEDQKVHKINVAICPVCKSKYVSRNFYKTFILTNKYANINFKDDLYIYLLDNSVISCKQCNSELASILTTVDIHYDISSKDDYVEKVVKENLFYCKKCHLLYANNAVKTHLLNKYGVNKIMFKHYKV